MPRSRESNFKNFFKAMLIEETRRTGAGVPLDEAFLLGWPG